MITSSYDKFDNKRFYDNCKLQDNMTLDFPISFI